MDYVRQHAELAYATTVHDGQGETVDQAHLLIGEATGAAAAYVGMTRGRHHNTAHFVAETVDEARAQWVDVFSRRCGTSSLRWRAPPTSSPSTSRMANSTENYWP